MAKKIDADSSFTANYSVRVEGVWAILEFMGKEKMRWNIKLQEEEWKALQVYREEIEGKATIVENELSGDKAVITEDEVVQFVQVYVGLVKRYTKRHVKYSNKSKTWEHFRKAASYAKQNEFDALTYIKTIMSYYSQRNPSDTMIMPYPNQLHGEWAQNIIVNDAAKSASQAPIELRMKKLAGTNRYLKLSEDTVYQKAMAKIKTGTYTEGDLVYLRARQTQVKGEPAEWLKKYEEKLRGGGNEEEA